jgi:hypothetical protein
MELSGMDLHDARLGRVIELPASDDILMEVSYVVDWERSISEPRVIAFRDVLDYEVHEGPFDGSPTILHVAEIDQQQGRSRLWIKTNAGYRTLLCSKVELLLPEEAGETFVPPRVIPSPTRAEPLCASCPW